MEDFEAIYIRYFNSVYKYVFSLCRNETIAEDMTQEAFYKAMEHMDDFDGKCKLYVWLCQIAKNTFYTYAKRQSRFAADADAAIPEQEAPDLERSLMDQETAWELHKKLHQLREPHKEVFSLRVFGELSFSQIGELFGRTESWARVVFYRAKKELRWNLNENRL